MRRFLTPSSLRGDDSLSPPCFAAPVVPDSSYTPTATGLLCDTAAVLLSTSPGLYPPTILSELFSMYDVDGDGLLSQSEYAEFCNTTEAGAGCDDKRWAAHKQTMGVPEGIDFLTLRCFSKLYEDKRLLKHYGQEQRDLERSRAAMEKLAKEKEKATVVRLCTGDTMWYGDTQADNIHTVLCRLFALTVHCCIAQIADFKKQQSAAAAAATEPNEQPKPKVAGVVNAKPASAKARPKSKKKKKKR